MLEWSLLLICHVLLRNGAAMTTNKSDCTTDSLEPKTILCTEPMEQSTAKKTKQDLQICVEMWAKIS